MIVDKETAMEVWENFYGDKEWVLDCFGLWINKKAYSNESVMMMRPRNSKNYDYSWNIDHIRPKSSFQNENDADFYNNLEPMHRLNNLEKTDNYPYFTIKNNKYHVVKFDNIKAYGIKNKNGEWIDWKGKNQRFYK